MLGVANWGYFARIQVYDSEAGIEENVTADLGDLLGSNPPGATVVERIDRVISELRESGKLTSSQ
jgi:hypothetical protein